MSKKRKYLMKVIYVDEEGRELRWIREELAESAFISLIQMIHFRSDTGYNPHKDRITLMSVREIG